ncbi:MAG TPA: vWA domain-containing protein, partial [Planctomycetota bacterium]|nr:vWA domain-containing protein [Planctomycetota bacterium]
MNDWLRFLLGLEEGEVPSGSKLEWKLSGLPSGIWLIAAGAVIVLSIALIVLLYRKESSLSRAQRLVLSGLRIGALALVVLILLNPRLETATELVRRGKAIVLVDTSASMTERDRFDDGEIARLSEAVGTAFNEPPARVDLARAALRHSRLVELLEERNDVELRVFDADTRPIEPDRVLGDGDIPVAGETSQLGDALISVVRDRGRAPIAGVIPITDGRVTGGTPLEEAMGELERERVPVWAVGVGRSRPLIDLVVDELVVPPRVEVDFPIRIEGRVSLHGAKGIVRAILERSRRDGSDPQVVGAMDLDPAAGVERTRVEFLDRIDQRGEWRYALRVPTLDGETQIENNVRYAMVEAAPQEYRLLLVAGNAVPEYRFLRNFAIRDDHIVVSTWQSTADPRFVQDGDLPIERMPSSAEELEIYDAIVFIDPDPSTLSEELQLALETFVAESGGGLAYVAGEANTPRIAKDAAFARLRRLLPVELDGRVLPPGTVYSEAWRPQLTAAGYDHPLCRLTNDPEDNLALWERAPYLYYAHGAGDLRPAAVALLASGEQAIAAVQRVGTGECVYIGTDELWTWRTANVAYHERFWSVLVRTLAIGKRLAGTQRVQLETERDRYTLGEPVRIDARVVDARRAPVTGALVDVIVERMRDANGDGARAVRNDSAARWSLRLAEQEASPGDYGAVFRAEGAGSYRVLHEESGSTLTFEVRPRATEFDDTTPDFAALEELGKTTGGGFAFIDSLEAVAMAVPRTEVRETIARRTTAVWDSWAMLVLFTGLIGLEWTF